MYDDLLGKRKKPKPKVPLKKRTKVAKWSVVTYSKEAYCYQCGETSIRVVSDKITGKKLVKKVQCNTCFAEWVEVWDENGELESIGFKF
jgi:hypothetical protein